jgi:hypothetical protein
LSQDHVLQHAYTAFEIVNVNTLKLTVTVNESQVVNLKKGTPITVTSVFIQVKNLMDHIHIGKSRQ